MNISSINKYKLAGIVFVMGMLFTLFVYNQFNQQQATSFNEKLEQQADKVERAIKQVLAEQYFIYRWMARQFEINGQPLQKERQLQAKQILSNKKFVSAIEYISPDYILKWSEPENQNQKLIGLSLKRFPALLEELEYAKTTDQISASVAIQKENSHQVLRLYIPIGTANNNQGFISSVINIEKLLGHAVRHSLDEGFQLNIVENNIELLKFYGDLTYVNDWRGINEFYILDRTWAINLWPTPEKLSEAKHHFDNVVLIAGTLISLLLAGIIQLVVNNQKHQKILKKTNLNLAMQVDERTKAESRLAELVEFDKLTGLYNRQALERYLSKLIQDQPKQLHCICILDLDGFKEVNGVLGHKNGDLLIKRVAQRIQRLIPESGFLARIGGDEFAIILSNIRHQQEAQTQIEKLIRAIDSRFVLDGYELYLSASAGIALNNDEDEDNDFITLYRNADSALNQAKEAGKNCVHCFSKQLQVDVNERISLLKRLRKAIENQEFVLYYQPKVDIRTGKCIGAEALIRWIDEDDNLIPPDQFIPIAEDSGLIIQIGEWVIKQACEQLAYWQKLGFDELSMAINLSGKQLQQDDLISQVISNQTQYGLKPQSIELELTEQVFIENVDKTTQFMKEVRERGFSLSIDDFGVGYSSLSYLKHFPVDTLKIDRSFVKNLPFDKDDVTIVQTIINLAHNLGLAVIAEGVEEINQLDFLASNNCYTVQGYLFSKPISGDDFTKFLINKHGQFSPSNEE